MACTAAVEDEIDAHYSEQLAALGDSDPELSASIARFQADEREHRDIALAAGAEQTSGLSLVIFRDPGGLPYRDRAFEEDLSHAHRPRLSRRRWPSPARSRAAARRRRCPRRRRPQSRGRPRRRPRQPADHLWRRSLPAEPDPNEVTVCARLPDADRYRVPPNLRDNPNDPASQSLGRPGDRAVLCRPHRHGQLLDGRRRRLHRLLQPDRQPGPRRAPRRRQRHQLDADDRGGARSAARSADRGRGAGGRGRRPAPRSRAAAAPHRPVIADGGAPSADLSREIGLTGSAFLVVQRHRRRRHLRSARDAPPEVRRVRALAVPAVRPARAADRPALRAARRAFIRDRAGRSPIPRPSGRSPPSRSAGSIMSRGSPRSPPMPTSSPLMPATLLAAARHHGRPRARSIAALVGALTLVNIVGVRRAIRALDAADPAEGAAADRPRHLGPRATPPRACPPPGPPPPLSALEASALVLLYAFVGFENSVGPGRRDARIRGRTIPRALHRHRSSPPPRSISSSSSLMPRSCRPGRRPTAPLAAFAQALIGPAGAIILALTALASVAGNVSGSMTSTPRVTYALAAQGSLPRLVRRGQRPLRDARPIRSCSWALVGAVAGAERQLRLARHRQHARPPRRLRRLHRRSAQSAAGRDLARARRRRPRGLRLGGGAVEVGKLGDARAGCARSGLRALRRWPRRQAGSSSAGDGLLDPAAAEHPVALVEHRRLAGRDAIFGPLEAHASAVEARRHRLRQRAHLDGRARRAGPRRASSPRVSRASRTASACFGPTTTRAALRLQPEHVERLALAADLEPAALADGEVDQARDGVPSTRPSRSTISPSTAASGRTFFTTLA